jgi:hypothetical protein
MAAPTVQDQAHSHGFQRDNRHRPDDQLGDPRQWPGNVLHSGPSQHRLVILRRHQPLRESDQRHRRWHGGQRRQALDEVGQLWDRGPSKNEPPRGAGDQ